MLPQAVTCPPRHACRGRGVKKILYVGFPPNRALEDPTPCMQNCLANSRASAHNRALEDLPRHPLHAELPGE